MSETLNFILLLNYNYCSGEDMKLNHTVWLFHHFHIVALSLLQYIVCVRYVWHAINKYKQHTFHFNGKLHVKVTI